ERQDPLVEVADVLDQGPLEVQARVLDQLFDLAQLEDDRALPLVHRERDQAEYDRHCDDYGDQGDGDAVVHGRSRPARPRGAWGGGAPVSGDAGGSVALGAGAAVWFSGGVPAADIWMILSSGR